MRLRRNKFLRQIGSGVDAITEIKINVLFFFLSSSIFEEMSEHSKNGSGLYAFAFLICSNSRALFFLLLDVLIVKSI